jgi:heptosyltransferase-1
MEKILVIRLTSMGDLVHTLPAVAALREAYPAAQIDWVVDRKWIPVLAGTPVVNRLIPFDHKPVGKLMASMREVRSGCYDTAIDFQGLYKSAVVAWYSGAKRRFGYSFSKAREPLAVMLYTDRVAPKEPHAVDRSISLAVHAGARRPATPQFPLRIPVAAVSSVNERLASNGIGEYIVVNPGTSVGFKRWPAERYGEVCRELHQRHGWKAIVVTGPREEHLAKTLRNSAAPAEPVVMDTTLPELMALLASAKMMIAADTGPLHLAAALGTPCVGIYGPTDPARNGPYTQNSVVVRNALPGETSYSRRSAYSPAILRVTVADVVTAAETLHQRNQ